MKQFDAKIRINAENAEDCREIANSLQFLMSNISQEDIKKLLNKVRSNPNILQTALKFI